MRPCLFPLHCYKEGIDSGSKGLVRFPGNGITTELLTYFYLFASCDKMHVYSKITLNLVMSLVQYID